MTPFLFTFMPLWGLLVISYLYKANTFGKWAHNMINIRYSCRVPPYLSNRMPICSQLVTSYAKHTYKWAHGMMTQMEMLIYFTRGELTPGWRLHASRTNCHMA